MKKILLAISWFSLTPIALLSLMAVVYAKSTNPLPILLTPNRLFSNQTTVKSSNSIVSQVNGISTDVQSGDARPIIIAEFLETHSSPLKPYQYYGHFLTNLADKYSLDFRLLPSIMMQESNLCKKIPKSSYNCLGLGIHSQGTWTFDSYEENFEAAANVLREKYLNEGLITPDEIQDKYTPGSNGSWEFAVNHFM
ncbi:hypothetical protein ACFL2V_21885, partial [Pseudomonadota bacterium]